MTLKEKLKEKGKIVSKGFLKENPVLRLVLGTCPSLAVTTLAANGIGMGIAATVVLICSNIAISALRKVIPDKVRIPAYITVIAGFVTLVMMVVQAYVPALNKSLGVFLPLIVVNCIILGRAEMFASKNTVFDSALDGLGMGIGFTIVLFLMGSVREIFGAGTFLGRQVLPAFIEPIGILVSPPGGFFIYGVLMAAAVKLELSPSSKEGVGCAGGCAGCALASSCSGTPEEQELVKEGAE